MSELTVEMLVEQLRRLRIAFPTHAGTKTPEGIIETAGVYLDGLHGLSDESVRYAVRQCIETEKFFPKIADLRIHASEWERRHTSRVEREAAWERCPVCGGRIEWVGLWAPAVDSRNQPITREVEGVVYFQLTTVARYRCERCATRPVFEPEENLALDGHWTRRDRITRRFGAAPYTVTREVGILPPLISDEQRERMREGAAKAREERARVDAARRGQSSTDPHAPEQIGDLAENLATRALEHA